MHVGCQRRHLACWCDISLLRPLSASARQLVSSQAHAGSLRRSARRPRNLRGEGPRPCLHISPITFTRTMDTLGIEPRASRMLSGCDAATPCAPADRVLRNTTTGESQFWTGVPPSSPRPNRRGVVANAIARHKLHVGRVSKASAC